MGIEYTSASNQGTINSTVPRLATNGALVTLAAWFRPYSTSGNKAALALTDTAGSTSYMFVGTSANLISFVLGTASETAVNGGIITTGDWGFCIGRNIAQGNHWVHGYLPRLGRVTSAQSTTVKSLSSLDRLSIGSVQASTILDPMDGVVAEVWYMDADIGAVLGVATGAALPDELVRQLALYGPFSVGPVVGNMVEYRSLRANAASVGQFGIGDEWCEAGYQTWTDVNGPLITADHPPLAPSYGRPDQTKQMLTI